MDDRELTREERQRLSQRAIAPPYSSVVGAGVVLAPSGNVLCSCPRQSDAELIAKLWNAATEE